MSIQEEIKQEIISEKGRKSILSSKTFWLNVIGIGIAIISITNPKTIGVEADQLLWISGILNIILRFVSSGEVSLTGSPAPTVKK